MSWGPRPGLRPAWGTGAPTREGSTLTVPGGLELHESGDRPVTKGRWRKRGRTRPGRGASAGPRAWSSLLVRLTLWSPHTGDPRALINSSSPLAWSASCAGPLVSEDEVARTGSRVPTGREGAPADSSGPRPHTRPPPGAADGAAAKHCRYC